MKLTGMTVEEAIAALSQFHPKTILVGDAGEATVSPIKKISTGFVYQWTKDKPHGMSNLFFTEDVQNGIPAIFIG